MTLGMSASSSSTTATSDDASKSVETAHAFRNRHLSNQSIHLLLILSNHFTNDVHRNPYRLALLHFTDTQGKTTARSEAMDSFIHVHHFFRHANKPARLRTVALVFARLPFSLRCSLPDGTNGSKHASLVHATPSQSALQSLRYITNKHRSDCKRLSLVVSFAH